MHIYSILKPSAKGACILFSLYLAIVEGVFINFPLDFKHYFCHNLPFFGNFNWECQYTEQNIGFQNYIDVAAVSPTSDTNLTKVLNSAVRWRQQACQSVDRRVYHTTTPIVRSDLLIITVTVDVN